MTLISIWVIWKVIRCFKGRCKRSNVPMVRYEYEQPNIRSFMGRRPALPPPELQPTDIETESRIYSYIDIARAGPPTTIVERELTSDMGYDVPRVRGTEYNRPSLQEPHYNTPRSNKQQKKGWKKKLLKVKLEKEREEIGLSGNPLLGTNEEYVEMSPITSPINDASSIEAKSTQNLSLIHI